MERMAFVGRISMRGRMMMLIVASLMPLGVLLAGWIVSSYGETLSHARRSVLQAAELAAARQAEVFSTSRILLDTIRAAPAVSVAGGVACHAALAELKAAAPQFLAVGITNAAGTVTCHNTQRTGHTVADASLVGRVLAPGAPDFVVGNFMIGKISKKPTIPVAMPMRDTAGKPIGMLFASLDLERLSAAGESVSLGGRRSIAMIQPSSKRVLTHFPRAQFSPGAVYADEPLLRAMLAAPAGGVTEAANYLNQPRLFGFVPIEGAETAGFMIAVGESTTALLNPIRGRAAWHVVFILAAVALALATAWWLGDYLHLRPVGRLHATAARVGAGDFAARADLSAWHAPELRRLGGTLDRMAAWLDDGRAAQEAVAASEARYRLLAENTADLVTCADPDGRRVFASPASRDMLGYEPEELIGQSGVSIVHPEDAGTFVTMMQQVRLGRRASNVQYRLRHRDGHYVWVEVNGRPTEDGSGVFSLRDITERRRMEFDLAEANRQLATLALTDALTGLFNRRAFDASLTEAVAYAADQRSELCLMMVDVDRFKSFNDRYGHTAGDDCLRRVGAEFRLVFRRPGISVARYGGEEFAVVLPEVSLSAALQEAEALRQSIRRLGIEHEGSEHGAVTVSIGIATLSAAAEAKPVDLVQRADRALYTAKARGRDRIEIGFAGEAMAS